MGQVLPPKKDVALALLERSNVDVYLDPRARGVVVPPQFRKEPRLILKIGLNMPVPIPDLRLDDDSMSCTLSFNRSPFYCVVPWPSVFAMVGEDGRGMVWPDDVPQELARVVEEQRQPSERGEATSSPSPVSAATSRKGRGRASDDDRASRAGDTSDAGAGRSKRPKKKKDEERPVLVAVPAPAPAADDDARARQAPPAERRANTGNPPERRDGVSAVPPARPAPSSRPPRPKRELPPYLRVVK